MIKDFKNMIITKNDSFDIYVEGKQLGNMFPHLMRNPKYKYANVYINNYEKFSSKCDDIGHVKNKQINIYLNGDKISRLVDDSKEIVNSIKKLPDNVKLCYRKLNEYDEVVNGDIESLNPWITNLPKDDFQDLIQSFDRGEQRYLLTQNEIIKEVYNKLYHKYPNFDDLTGDQKLNIIYDYLNTNITLSSSNNDPVEVFIHKHGNHSSIMKLFQTLSNNRKVKVNTIIEKNKVINADTLKIYDFYLFKGKENDIFTKKLKKSIK